MRRFTLFIAVWRKVQTFENERLSAHRQHHQGRNAPARAHQQVAGSTTQLSAVKHLQTLQKRVHRHLPAAAYL